MLPTLIVLIALSANGFRIACQPGEVLGWYENLISRLPEWIYKPLGGCAKCFAGQIALWSYFIHPNGIFIHVLFIFSTIAVTYFIELIIMRYE